MDLLEVTREFTLIIKILYETNWLQKIITYETKGYPTMQSESRSDDWTPSLHDRWINFVSSRWTFLDSLWQNLSQNQQMAFQTFPQNVPN